QLADDPTRSTTISVEVAASLLLRCAAVQTTLATRLMTEVLASSKSEGRDGGDTLVDVHEAAERLRVSRDWVYRRARQLPFTVNIGRNVRFSTGGIDKYIRERAGQ